MKTKSEIAVAKFLEGYNCAQAVLYSFCDDLRMEKETALKLACGFGAGMGRKQEVCGAVTGGILVIGAKLGRGEKDDRAATELTYAKTRELMEQFVHRQGTYICRRRLNGCDLTTQEGQEYYKEKDLLNRTCVPCIHSIVEILGQMV